MPNVNDNLLRASPQLPPFLGTPPLPLDNSGVLDAYALRHVCGIAGKGRSLPGDYPYPDPYDATQDPTSPDGESWELRHAPAILLLLDNDALWRYFLGIVERERLSHTEAIASFLDLFDADKCPEEYLPYLAYTIGISLGDITSIPGKRARIKNAITLYKEKGKVSAVVQFFNSIGYTVNVKQVYILPSSGYRRSLLEAAFAAAGYSLSTYLDGDTLSWSVSGAESSVYPPGYDDGLLTASHCIDVILTTYKGNPFDLNAGSLYKVKTKVPTIEAGQAGPEYWATEKHTFPATIKNVADLIRELRAAFEEVRPIHVILRLFGLFFRVEDVWPVIQELTETHLRWTPHDDFLPVSGRFLNWPLQGTNVALKETNAIMPIVHDGMSVFFHNGEIQHRVGFPVTYGDPIAQQYVSRRYWGPFEPHTLDETVQLVPDGDTWDNPPAGSPPGIESFMAIPDLVEDFDAGSGTSTDPLTGNPYLLPVTTDVSASWNFNYQLDQRQWGRFVCPASREAYFYFNASGLQVKTPFVVEFDYQPLAYADTGGGTLVASGTPIVTFHNTNTNAPPLWVTTSPGYTAGSTSGGGATVFPEDTTFNSTFEPVTTLPATTAAPTTLTTLTTLSTAPSTTLSTTTAASTVSSTATSTFSTTNSTTFSTTTTLSTSTAAPTTLTTSTLSTSTLTTSSAPVASGTIGRIETTSAITSASTLVSIAWRNAGAGAGSLTALGTIPVRSLSRIKVAIWASNNVRVYVDEYRLPNPISTFGLAGGVPQNCSVIFGAYNAGSGLPACVGHYKDIAIGRGFFALVEDVLDIYSNTNLTGTTPPPTTFTTTSTTTITTTTASSTITTTLTTTSTVTLSTSQTLTTASSFFTTLTSTSSGTTTGTSTTLTTTTGTSTTLTTTTVTSTTTTLTTTTGTTSTLSTSTGVPTTFQSQASGTFIPFGD